MERIRVKVNGENIQNEISFEHGIDTKTGESLNVEFYKHDDIELLRKGELYDISIGDHKFSDKWILKSIGVYSKSDMLTYYIYTFIPSGIFY